MTPITRRALIATAAALAAAPALAQQPTKITWVTHPVIYETTDRGRLLKEFQAKTGIEVEVVTYPGAQMFQKVSAELIAGSGAYDVATFNDNMFNQDTYKFFEPLDAFTKESPIPDGGIEDFVPAMVDQYRVPQVKEGVTYGIPNRMSGDILFYRKDLLEQAGLSVPKTWQEYYEAAKKLTVVKNGKTEIYGAVLQGGSESGLLDWYDWAASTGADILTPPDWKKAAMNSPQAVAALALRARMIKEGLISPASVGYNFDDAINAMAQGNAAMTVMYSAYWTRLEDSARSKIAGKVGYAAMPRDPSVQHAYYNRGWGLMIPKDSKRKKAAWEFIRYITSKEVQLYMATAQGNAATRLSVFSDPAFEAKVPIAKALADTMPRSKILPNVPGMNLMYDYAAKQMQRALSGDAAPEQVMAEINEYIGKRLPK